MCDQETRKEFETLHGKVDAIHRRLDDHIKEETLERQEFTKAIEANTKAVADVANSVKDVVSAYNDLQATVRVGSNVQKFVIWLGKWGIVGGAIAASITWITNHIPHS